jgi:dTDP-4-dehydrorhamnose reductase
MYARTKLDAEKRVMQINPDALVARINIFGWSLNGSRSLAEMFYNNLSNEKPVKGFTDVIFCPLLVNDLSHILMESVALGLKGLYHMVSCDSLSKYEFGVRIAKIFGFDAKLISPVSWKEGGLLGNRSPDLRVSAAKLAKHLGKATPSVDDGLTRFHGLFQTGYAQHLQSMRFGRGSGQ